MKNIFKTLAAIASAVVVLAGLSACQKSGPTQGDYTKLNALVTECETLANSATTKDYPQEAITNFKNVIATVKAAVAKGGLEQTKIDNLYTQLEAAKTTFQDAKYGAIPSAALVFGLSFDEGTGKELTTTGNKWTAKFVKGPEAHFGAAAAEPKWVDGKKGKAVDLQGGAALHISDYVPTAMPTKALSISVWVKPSQVYAGNYILSYNYWNTFKFQVQDGGKPFLTAKAGEACIDMDNEMDNSAPVNTWTHLCVTADFTTKKCNFYVNGTLTKEWVKDAWGATLASYEKTLPIVIGACTTLDEAKTWEWYPTEPSPTNWDSFRGCIDELALYNIALTDGQVSSLYNAAK